MLKGIHTGTEEGRMPAGRWALALVLAGLTACMGNSGTGGIQARLQFPFGAEAAQSSARFRTAAAPADFALPETVVLAALADGQTAAQAEFPYESGGGELSPVNPGTFRVMAEGRSGGRTLYRGFVDGVVVEAGMIADAGIIVMNPVSLAPPMLASAPPAVTREAALVLTGYKQSGTGILVNGLTRVDPDTATEFTLTVTLREGANAISLAAIDRAGGSSETIAIGIVLDTEAPVLRAVSFAGNPAAVSTTTLTLSVNADGASDLQISETRNWSTAEKIRYSTSVSVTLTQGDGQKTVHVRALDAVGNVSEELNASVVLDTTPPAKPIVTVTSGTIQSGSFIPLSVSAPDAAQLQVAGTPSFQGATWQVFRSAPTFFPTAPDGLTLVYVRVRDAVGNTSLTAKASTVFSRMNISGLTPAFGLPGSEITLSGSGFGAAQDTAQVWFGTAVTEAIAWSDTSITLRVPPGSMPGLQPIFLRRNEGVSNQVFFENKRPWIDTRWPRHVSAGTTVSVNGRYLGATTGSVYDGEFLASSLSWTDTGVSLWANETPGGAQALKLVAGNGLSTNTVPLVHRGSDHWIGFSDAPHARSEHTAVWSGTEMIVWGGDANLDAPLSSGARYNPATDTWLPVSMTGAPSARRGHSAVWSGSEVLVWGGIPYTQNGGRYSPLTDSWWPMSVTGAPAERQKHTALWSGSEMIVWGGYDNSGSFQNGGRYNPQTDTWSTISLTGAPANGSGHVAVWTGREMIVWGGGVPDGGRYDPQSDTWRPTSTSGAPSNRDNPTAVWTGREMIVWGGEVNEVALADGARYFPAEDRWEALSPAPIDGRYAHTAIWTGDKMIVWGGGQWGGSDGALYDPLADKWTHSVAQASSPASRRNHSAVWTGTEMIVWGGRTSQVVHNDGARYDPASDSWIPVAGLDPQTPSPRDGHSMVWTGSEVIVWGGSRWNIAGVDGARYSPATDTWYPMSASGPSARYGHTAVWTGLEMLVWGGCVDEYGCPAVLGDGGRYDPSVDAWTPMSTVQAPAGRAGHVAAWADTELLIWGGSDGVSYLNSGAAYAPDVDSWYPLSVSGAPSAREEAAAVWTGTEFIVWGGTSGTDENTGARLAWPANTWSPMAVTGGLAPRRESIAVWTGSSVFVYGGVSGIYPGETYLGDGALYTPATDSWQTISATGSPGARAHAAAVFTGGNVILWGGQNSRYGASSSGARYDVVSDTWFPLAGGLYVPSPVPYMTSVFTGTELFIWGGEGNGWPINTGGIYRP